MTEEVIPVYASSFFSVSSEGEFHQFLQYDYYDPKGYYTHLAEEEVSKEVQTCWANMQGYLEEETNKVNGKMVYPEVDFCDIQFHGSWKNPFIVWVITFRGEFQSGINVYETRTDEEKLEYDCYVIWQFPRTTKKILAVDTKLYHDILGNRIVLWGDKGMTIGGKEFIRFELT